MKTTIATLIALTALNFSQAANRVDIRQEKQAERIENGVESGALTAKEAGKLENQQERIAGLEAKFREDGKLGKRDKVVLEVHQDKASRNIYREKHDRQMVGRNRLKIAHKKEMRAIRHGIKSGALTRKEVRKLKRDQTRLVKMERRAMSDGKLTNAEKRKIGRAHKAERIRIRRMKNN